MRNEAAQLPNNLQQWVPVILTTILLTIVFITGVAVAQRQNDEQFISNDVLQQSVENLVSYSEEAALLSKYSLNHSAPRAYTEAYSSALKKAADSTAEKLVEHPHDSKIDDKVNTVIGLGQQLSVQLQELGSEPVNQLSSTQDFSGSFSHLSDQLQQLEQSL